MQELSINKKLKIVKLCLAGFSYDEIAQKTGVSKGTVANVISDLKAGLFPEVSTVPEEIEQLRDLAVSLRRSGISPVQANIGLSVLGRLNAIDIEPSEIEKCHTLLQALSPPDKDLVAMAKSILAIEEVKQKTGLTLEDLEDKVVSLRQEAKQLAPVSEQIEVRKKELLELEKDHNGLTDKIKELRKRETTLSDYVNNLEAKEVRLHNHVTELEERVRAADKQLTDARRDLKTLDIIGMGIHELSRFTIKLKEISAHQDIKPGDLTRRLLKELKTLDKGLNLEYSVKEREAQLDKVKQEVAKEQAEKENLHSYLRQLTLEKARLEAQLSQYHKQLTNDITTLSEASKKAIQEINDSLKLGMKNSISEVNKLADEAVKLGKEVGKLEASIESLSWIKPLLSMV